MPRQFDTLVQLLDQSAEDYAANELFGTKLEGGAWRWIHYRDFAELVAQARGGLAAHGVGKGDLVGVVSNNRVEWAALAFATYGLGAALVPMYEAQPPAEWTFILRDCGAKVVAGATEAIYTALTEARTECPKLQHVLGFDLPAAHDDSWAKLLSAGRDAPAPAAEVGPGDLSSLIYTSGTTGDPKGVRLTHRNQCSNVLAAAERFDFGPGDRSLAFLPWAHSFGQTCELFTLFHFGAALAINDEVPALVDNLAVVRPTVLVAVPRIFNRIYDGVNKQMAERPAAIQKLFSAGVAAATKKNRGQSLSLPEKLALGAADRLIFSKVRMKFGGRLRFVVSGSAALSTEVAEFIDALGIEVYEGYGLTETSPVAAANYPGHRKIGSVGPAFPGVEVRIDRSVTGDEVNGEIIISGPNVMQGYHERPEDTAQVLMEDGSFRSGDMGYLDADGYLYITGRIKEQYKLENGKYVVPSPLEEELKLSPFVSNCMLHGHNKPHNVALVVPDMPALENWAKKNGIELGDPAKNAEVKRLLQGELDKYSASFKGYERPKNIAIVTDEFTQENEMLTPTMKLKRRNVLEAYGDLLEALYE